MSNPENKIESVIQDLKRIHESEEIHSLPEVIKELQDLIDEHDLTLEDVEMWCEESPENIAYLMCFGSASEQQFGSDLVTAIDTINKTGNSRKVSPNKAG